MCEIVYKTDATRSAVSLCVYLSLSLCCFVSVCCLFASLSVCVSLCVYLSLCGSLCVSPQTPEPLREVRSTAKHTVREICCKTQWNNAPPAGGDKSRQPNRQTLYESEISLCVFHLSVGEGGRRRSEAEW